MVDFKSVYRGYEIKDKVERICKDLNLNSTNILDAEIQLAINKYMEIQQTPTMRLLMDMESCLDKIGFTFRTYNPTTDTNAVKFKALTTAMKSVDGIIKGLNALKETVETETANITRGKGGHRVGKRELPKKRNSDE